MKPAPFSYGRSASIADAVAMLGSASDGTRVLGGGQTLGPMLNLRVAPASRLVDIGHIGELRRVARRDGSLIIGAGTTHAMLEDSLDPSPTARLLARVAAGIAYRAVRNRGTIGGSLAHADPAADWVTTMTLFDAKLTLASVAGTRCVLMRDFVQAPFVTAIAPGEVLVEIEVAELSAEAVWGYYKVSRKVGEFAHAIGAVLLDPATARARIVAGALDRVPASLPALAARVARTGAAATTLGDVMAELSDEVPGLDPVDLQIHAVAVRRAIQQALA